MRGDRENVFRLSQPEAEQGDEPAETAGTHSLKPLDRSAAIEKKQRTLPHWSQDGCTYFVTFPLADAVAAPVWKKWKEQRATWLAMHPKPWDTATQKDYNTRFPAQMELWLDAGYGSCALKDPTLRNLVEKAMRHFDGQHFKLGHYVLMPNHVHVLLAPFEGHSLAACRI
jgi:hypothetical protein